MLGFRWSKKAKITLETASFGKNISINIFKFSPYFCTKLANEIYQFLKICKRFDKESEKTLMQQSIRKEKLRKVGLFFMTDCFIKSFNMIINPFFCFASSFAAQYLHFYIRMTQEIIKRRSRERQIARNGKLQYLFQK